MSRLVLYFRKAFVRAYTRRTRSGRSVQVGGYYDRRAPHRDTQARQAAAGYSDEHVHAYVRAHRPALKQTVSALDSLVSDLGTVEGRLKAPESLKGKLEGRYRGNPIEDATDIAGTRVTAPTLEKAQEAMHRIERTFKVTERNDYLEGHPSGSGYRSVHYIVEVAGRPVELQVRTPRQTRWADWAHDTTYKGDVGKAPGVAEYARGMSDYFHALDRGQTHDAHKPDCPEALRSQRLCLE